MQQIENSMCDCSALRSMQNRKEKNEILWTWFYVRIKKNRGLLFWVSACVRNAVCLHLCFSYCRRGSPWDIEG